MSDAPALASLQAWLQEVRAHVALVAPELLLLFDTYSGEAVFGRTVIADDLERLPAGAIVLEVGSGSMLLSCQLAREGYRVHALEPIGTGFSHFDRMRELVLALASAQHCKPTILDHVAEDLQVRRTFDYAFSINVMEHVTDVAAVLNRVVASLKPGAQYRFVCPNYLFPYEPHFNLPTLFSKSLTEKVLRRRIMGCRHMPDPAGMWRSLNWIDVVQLRRLADRMPGVRMEFGRQFLVATLERMESDAGFALRRSPLIRWVVSCLVRSRLHRLFGWIPVVMHPVIDCRLRAAQTAGGAWPR